jgi:hypothetical protein
MGSKRCKNCGWAIEPDGDTESGWCHVVTGSMFCAGSLDHVAEPEADAKAGSPP